MTGEPVFIRLICHDGTVKEIHKVVKAVFVKDFYSPCTRLSVKAYADEGVNVFPPNVRRVEFYIGSKKLHSGLPDSLSIRRQGGAALVETVSRGVTVTLCQSEPEPGIWTQTNLYDCLRRAGSPSEITCESGTEKTNYVNIAEGSTSWEAVCAYALKEYATYPYIRSCSKLMVTRSDDRITVKAPVIFSTGRALDTKNLMSALYMQDLSGEYADSVSDDFAGSLGIVRERYLPLDQQWLHDEEQGLKMRLAYSKRASRGYRMTYAGYHGEDLTDHVLVTDVGSLSTNLTVSALRIEVSHIGIITTIFQYNDGFF